MGCDDPKAFGSKQAKNHLLVKEYLEENDLFSSITIKRDSHRKKLC
ncbi:hypothetical protein VDIAB_260017 [Vibrio diabolicus]|nr:hypothetical protein VDIAB_260017 [Vibrio diabolicus]